MEADFSSENQALTRCALVRTNPTGELITCGLPVIRRQSAGGFHLPTTRLPGLCGEFQFIVANEGPVRKNLALRFARATFHNRLPRPEHGTERQNCVKNRSTTR